MTSPNLSEFKKWWHASDYSNMHDIPDPEELAKDAWDAAMLLASRIVIGKVIPDEPGY